jgi:hypothetical protein
MVGSRLRTLCSLRALHYLPFTNYENTSGNRVNNWNVETVKHLIDKNYNLTKIHLHCVIAKAYISQHTVIQNHSKFFKIYLRNKCRLDISHYQTSVFISSIYSAFCKRCDLTPICR